jgi:hypothetical protein
MSAIFSSRKEGLGKEYNKQQQEMKLGGIM